MGSVNQQKNEARDLKGIFNNRKLDFVRTSFQDEDGFIHVADTFDEYMRCMDKKWKVVSVGDV